MVYQSRTKTHLYCSIPPQFGMRGLKWLQNGRDGSDHETSQCTYQTVQYGYPFKMDAWCWSFAYSVINRRYSSVLVAAIMSYYTTSLSSSRSVRAICHYCIRTCVNTGTV